MIDKSLDSKKTCTCGERSGCCNSLCACSGKCNAKEIEFPPDDDEYWGTTSDIGVETERVPSISLTDVLGESFFEQLKTHLKHEQERKVIERDNEAKPEELKNIGEMDVQIVNFSNKINNENKRIYIIKMKVNLNKKNGEENNEEGNEVKQFDMKGHNEDDVSIKSEEKSNQTFSISTDNSIEKSAQYHSVNAIKRTDEETDVKQPKLHLPYISEKSNKTESSQIYDKGTEVDDIILINSNNDFNVKQNDDEREQNPNHFSSTVKQEKTSKEKTESDKIQILKDIKHLLTIDNDVRVIDMDRYNKFVYIIQSDPSQLNIPSEHSGEKSTIDTTESPTTIKEEPLIDNEKAKITSINNFMQEVIDNHLVNQINIDTGKLDINSIEFYKDILPEESIASEQRTSYDAIEEFGSKLDNIWTSKDIFIESPMESMKSVPISENLSHVSVNPATTINLPESESLSSKLINIACAFFHSIKNIMHYNTPESSENSSIYGAMSNSAIDEIRCERKVSDGISECNINEPHVIFYDMTKINSRLLWTNSPFFDRCMYVKSLKETRLDDEIAQKNPLKRDKKLMDLQASVQDVTNNLDNVNINQEVNSDELTQTTLIKDINLTIIIKTDEAVEGGDLKKVFSMHRKSKKPHLDRNINKDSNFYIFIKKEQINELVDSEDFSLPINQSSAKLKDETSKTVDKSLTARVLTDKLDKCTNTCNANTYRKMYCY